MQARKPIQKGQRWLIRYLKELGYKPDSAGVCFGIASMAVQALLVGEIDNFNELLHFINSTSDILALTDNIRKKRKLNSGMKLTKAEEMIAFLEGIQIFQDPDDYQACWDQKVIKQDFFKTAVLIESKNLKENGGVAAIKIFSGVYTGTDLKIYFEQLKATLINFNKPIAFMLESFDHAITIGFDYFTKEWLLIEPNRLPTQRIYSEMDLSKAISKSFSKNANIVFTTKIYTLNKNKVKAAWLVNNWLEKHKIKQLHQIYTEKIALTDSAGISWLYIAAETNDIQQVEALIRAGADVNKVENRGETPLYIAAYRGYYNVVKTLLGAGADTNKAEKDGETPLYVAVKYGHFEVVKLLMNVKADIDKADIYGKTPLYIAAKRGRLEIIKLLLRAKAKINKANKNQQTPLHAAIESENIDLIAALLEARPDVNKTDNDGATPLHIAINHKDIEIINLLLAARANVNQVNKKGNTPLLIAACQGYLNVVEILCDAQADVNQINHAWETPLFIAALNGHTEIVKTLLNAKANMHHINNNGETLLYIAAEYGRVEIVRTILNTKIDINQANHAGRTPLYIATYKGHVEIVKILLNAKANVNHAPKTGFAPLHVAVLLNNVEMIELMIQANANVNLLNNEGQAPLYIAAKCGHLKIVELLLRCNAQKKPCKTTRESLKFLATIYSDTVKIAIENFLQDKTDPIYIYPSEIAKIMGHQVIVDLIDNHNHYVFTSSAFFTPSHSSNEQFRPQNKKRKMR